MRAATDTMMAAGVAAGRAALPHADGQIGYAQVRAIWQAMTTIEALEAQAREGEAGMLAMSSHAPDHEGWVAHIPGSMIPPVHPEAWVAVRLASGSMGSNFASEYDWSDQPDTENRIVAYKVLSPQRLNTTRARETSVSRDATFSTGGAENLGAVCGTGINFRDS